MQQQSRRRGPAAVAVASAAVLACLFAPVAATSANTNKHRDRSSFCPEGFEYLVGLQCDETAPITLNCVPELLRKELCTLPRTVWAELQCKEQVGRLVTPKLIESITGCYSIGDGPWDELAVSVPDAFRKHRFCGSFPVTVTDAYIKSFDSKDSFEGPDPLAAWNVDTSADPDPDFAINVVCEGEPPDYSVGEYDDYGDTFTNLIGEAADGKCAARIRAGCTVDYTVGGTNTLSREFRVANRGCTPGMMAYDLTFAVAFDAREICEKYDYDIPFNDFAEIFVTVGGKETLVKRFSICKDEDSKAFEFVKVDLGKVAVGSTVSPEISVRVTNAVDCVFDSIVILDAVEITPRVDTTPPPADTQPPSPPTRERSPRRAQEPAQSPGA